MPLAYCSGEFFRFSKLGTCGAPGLCRLQTTQKSLLHQAVRICAYALVHLCQLKLPMQLLSRMFWLKHAQQQLQLEQNTHLWRGDAEGLMQPS